MVGKVPGPLARANTRPSLDLHTFPENKCWQKVCAAVRLRLGRKALRAGHSRFISDDIITALAPREGDTLCAAMHADRLNAVALGRWLNRGSWMRRWTGLCCGPHRAGTRPLNTGSHGGDRHEHREMGENANGNYVALDLNGVIATVYETDDGYWSAVLNDATSGPRRLKGKRGSAEDVQRIVEHTELHGMDVDQWYPPDCEWQPRKEGGCYRKLSSSIVSVKQAKSGSWFAAMRGAQLGHGGHPTWFATEHEAVKAVEQLEHGGNGLKWIRRQ